MNDQATSPLSPEDLAENQAGRLSGAQRRRYGAFARSDRKNELVGTLVLGALAVLLFTEHGPATNTLLRLAVASASALGAVFFLVRGLTGADALSRDLADTHVDRVEGAVERQVSRSTGRGSSPPATTSRSAGSGTTRSKTPTMRRRRPATWRCTCCDTAPVS